MRGFLLALLLLTAQVQAAQETLIFRSEHQEEQYRQLTTQLRCPQCQNTSIADSGSPVAADLRLKVYALLQEGKTPVEIVNFMVARYGNFISYDPPLTPLTVLLWLLPLAAVAGGAGAIYARSRRGPLTASRLPPPTPVRTKKREGSRWLLLPGGIAALLVSGIAWTMTNSLQQVEAWRQAEVALPSLLTQMSVPRAAPLDRQTLQTLALGLRTRLNDDPVNASGWALLGRVGMMLNDPEVAIPAFSRAHQLAPDNLTMALEFADAMTRTDDPQQLRQAGDLLNALMEHYPREPRVARLFALNAWQQHRYPDAIAGWQTLLTLLPGDDPQRAETQRLIAMAQKLAGPAMPADDL